MDGSNKLLHNINQKYNTKGVLSLKSNQVTFRALILANSFIISFMSKISHKSLSLDTRNKLFSLSWFIEVSK